MKAAQRTGSVVKGARLGRAVCAVAFGASLAACGNNGDRDGNGGPIITTSPLIPKVLSVTIVTTPGVLVVGELAQLAVSVGTVDGALAVVGWSSSNNAVATVSNSGLVTAISLGVTTVTATSLVDTTKRGSIDITVGLRPAVSSVSITPTSATIGISATAQLTASVSTVGSASTAVTWTTSDQAIATVSPTGLVTGVSEGTASITARSNFDATRSSTIPVTIVRSP